MPFMVRVVQVPIAAPAVQLPVTMPAPVAATKPGTVQAAVAAPPPTALSLTQPVPSMVPVVLVPIAALAARLLVTTLDPVAATKPGPVRAAVAVHQPAALSLTQLVRSMVHAVLVPIAAPAAQRLATTQVPVAATKPGPVQAAVAAVPHLALSLMLPVFQLDVL